MELYSSNSNETNQVLHLHCAPEVPSHFRKLDLRSRLIDGSARPFLRVSL